jgi:hypothetical protein
MGATIMKVLCTRDGSQTMVGEKLRELGPKLIFLS